MIEFKEVESAKPVFKPQKQNKELIIEGTPQSETLALPSNIAKETASIKMKGNGGNDTFEINQSVLPQDSKAINIEVQGSTESDVFNIRNSRASKTIVYGSHTGFAKPGDQDDTFNIWPSSASPTNSQETRLTDIRPSTKNSVINLYGSDWEAPIDMRPIDGSNDLKYHNSKTNEEVLLRPYTAHDWRIPGTELLDASTSWLHNLPWYIGGGIVPTTHLNKLIWIPDYSQVNRNVQP